MAIPLDELLTRIPSDTEARVKRTRDGVNQLLREQLRRLTGFRFAASPSDPETGAGDVRVPVELVPGLPVALRDVQIDDEDLVLALLSLHRSELESLKAGSNAIIGIIPELLADPRGLELTAGRERHLGPVSALAEDLLRAVAKFDLLGKILEVNEDVLGAYHFGQVNLFREESHIELYWGVIGLVAPLLQVSVEALTPVVLAHELAHAFTHVGADIDGHRWDTDAFRGSQRYLTEGLAQYYTASACDKLGEHASQTVTAYKRLLKKQPPAYHAHVPWLESHSPEEVRLAMIQTRRMGFRKLSDFEALLKEAAKGLKA